MDACGDEEDGALASRPGHGKGTTPLAYGRKLQPRSIGGIDKRCNARTRRRGDRERSGIAGLRDFDGDRVCPNKDRNG